MKSTSCIDGLHERTALPQITPLTLCSWLGRKVTSCVNWLQERYHDIAKFVANFFKTNEQPHAVRTHKAISAKYAVSTGTASLDPAMKQLQAFITNTFIMLGTSVYTQKIAPAVSSFLSNPSVQLWQNASWEALSLKIATTISNEIIQVFDNALAASTGEVKLLLSWLLGDVPTDTITKALNAAYKDLQQAEPNVVREFVGWLNNKAWLLTDAAIPSPQSACQNADPSILQKLLVTSLQTLIDAKAKAFFEEASSTLQSKIAPTLEATIKTNSTIVGQVVGTRFATLIQATSPVNNPPAITIYQQSYDQVLTLIYNQIDSIANAAKSGNDATKLLKAFASSDACDPKIRSLLNPPAGVDQADYQSQIEQAISDQIAKRLIDLLLPDEKSEQGDFSFSTSGIILLLRELQFPDSLQQAFNKFVSWPEGFFPDGPPASVEMLFSAVKYFLEKGVAAIIYDGLKAGLSKGLELGMNYAIPPAYLNMWMVQGAFPAIFQALVQGLLANTLQTPSDDIAGAFLPLSQANCNRQNAYAMLAPKLYIPVYRACNGIDLEKAGMNMMAFSQSMTPFLNQISDYLVQQAGAKQASTAQIKQWLIEYTKPVDAGSNSTYGNLLMDLMFYVGNFKLLGNQTLAKELCQVFLKNLMSRSLTSALNPLRASEELLVIGLLSGLATVMSTQTQIDTIVFGPPLQSTDVSKQLSLQLDQTASLIDSLTRQVIGQLPNDSNWFTSPLKKLGVDAIKKLLPSHGDFTQTIAKIYTTVLGNRYMNENLYLQVIDVILKGLEDAAESAV